MSFQKFIFHANLISGAIVWLIAVLTNSDPVDRIIAFVGISLQFVSLWIIVKVSYDLFGPDEERQAGHSQQIFVNYNNDKK